MALPEPGRFSLETNTVSLVMKERFNLVSLQVSTFSTVSPFATVNTHCASHECSSGRFSSVSQCLQKVWGSRSAERTAGCIIFFPLLLRGAKPGHWLLSCASPLSLHEEAWICSKEWQRAFSLPAPELDAALMHRLQAVQICPYFHTV